MITDLAAGLMLTAPAWGIGELVGRGIMTYRKRPKAPKIPRGEWRLDDMRRQQRLIQDYHEKVKQYHKTIGAYARSIEFGTDTWMN